MTLRTAFRLSLQAIRENILPGLLLQCLMVIFFSTYLAHEGTRQFLAAVALRKEEMGYAFAFISYFLAGGILPEVLKIAFFQGGKVKRQNGWNILTAAPAWGAIGFVVDTFYRLQEWMWGTGHDLLTLVPKVLVDQFVFSPFLCTPLAVIYFLWRDSGYQASIFRQVFRRSFFPERILPVQAAAWVIWIPGVTLVYLMPSLLQIPVAVLIQAYWVLVFTLLAGGTQSAR